MQIQKIQTNNCYNTNFYAKLYPYPHTCTNKAILESFEKKTIAYPDLILDHENISYFGKDHFKLLNSKNSNEFVAHGWYTHTSNPPETEDGYVDNFLFIFHDLLKKAEQPVSDDK